MDQETLLALLAPARAASAEEKEFRDWIKEKAEIFAERTSDEIAYFALANNFNPRIVYGVLSSFRDAMNGTSLENRAAFEAFRFDVAVQDFSRLKTDLERVKELDLMPLWKDLAEYTGGGQL